MDPIKIFGDCIMFMKEGKMIADIRDHAQVTTELIKEVFDVEVRIMRQGGEKCG